MPSILVAALVAFLLGYTEFALAWLFIDSERNVTLAMVLTAAQTGFFTSNWSGTAAHALLMTVPVVVIFVVLQRALLRNTLVGGRLTGYFAGGSTSLCSTAYRAAWVRDASPSLPRMFET